MTKVEFYVISADKQKSFLFACRLIEKIYHAQQTIYIHTASKNQAEEFDALLWTYQEDSFIPHQILDANNIDVSVLVGYGSVNTGYAKNIALNISKELPIFFNDFNHIIELVFDDPEHQALARERFRQYREKNFDLTTHKIKANQL